MRDRKMLLLAAAVALWNPVFAQTAAEYPTKVVRVIVGSAPGGGADQSARMFSQKLGEYLKNQFVVDNRPGAGDMLATGAAAKSPPDGYTLMVAGPGFTIAPGLYPSFTVDPLKDFTPISLASRQPLLLVVHPSLPVKSVKDLIALAKSKPGALDMSIVTGGLSHLATAHFTSMASIKLSFIPYKGVGQSVVDAISGQVPLLMGNTLTTVPHVKSGRLRALAVSTTERSSTLPDLPTISESGVPGYDVSAWAGWVAPAGTSPAIVSKLSAEIARAVKSPDIAGRIKEGGSEPVGSSGEQFGQLIAAEVPRWRKIIKDLNIRAE